MASVGVALPVEDAEINWEALFQREYRRLVTLAAIILRDSEDAADVVQRVFEKAYKQRERLDPSLTLGAWLTRVTCNEAISLGRSQATA